MLTNFLIVGAILFALGAVGFLSRRNMIVMFLSVEMMLQGVGLNLVAFGREWQNAHGQMFTIFVLAVAAAEAALALVLVLALYRRRHSLDVSLWQDLREPDQPPVVDRLDEVAAAHEPAVEWPKLTPAGIEPEKPRQEVEETADV
jgi:NADH-quinone oxidoreductase subunit K